MPSALQDFHYIAVLNELDKAARKLAGKEKVPEGSYQRYDRASTLYQTVRNLAAFWTSPEQNINLSLGAEQATLHKLEKEMVARIAKATNESRGGGEYRQLAGNWPPVVPLVRMTERFTASTIGLQSEDPGKPFQQHIVDAFTASVLPALAWGLVIEVYAYPKSQRRSFQDALARHLQSGESANILHLDDGTKAAIDYLVLVEAWFKALESPALGKVAKEATTSLRAQLAELIRMDLGELDTHLLEKIGNQYLGESIGSERARVIEEAQKAVFLRNRLSLFQAASSERIQSFRRLTEHDPAKALKAPFVALSSGNCDHVAGTEACGAAFWLARASFGKHAGPHDLLAREASTRALLLLAKAGAMFRNIPSTDDRLLTCLRYAAGFATNPRYARSFCVLHLQEDLVDLYAAHPQARTALVAHFRGRIAWQNWHATEMRATPKFALESFYQALHTARKEGQGFDAESPIHFFPELTVLLSQTGRDKGKAKKTLKAVDFITQKNYGIYFDIDQEKQKILAGLDDYKRYHAARSSNQKISVFDAIPKGEDADLDDFRALDSSKIVRDILGAVKELRKELTLYQRNT